MIPIQRLNSLSIKKYPFYLFIYSFKKRINFQNNSDSCRKSEGFPIFLTRTTFYNRITNFSTKFHPSYFPLVFHQYYCHQYAQLICISLHFTNVFPTCQQPNPFDFWRHIERVKGRINAVDHRFFSRTAPRRVSLVSAPFPSNLRGKIQRVLLERGRSKKRTPRENRLARVYQRGKANAREQSQPRVTPLNGSKQTDASVKTIRGREKTIKTIHISLKRRTVQA